MSNEIQPLIERLRSHISMMAPHQKERQAGQLLIELLAKAQGLERELATLKNCLWLEIPSSSGGHYTILKKDIGELWDWMKDNVQGLAEGSDGMNALCDLKALKAENVAMKKSIDQALQDCVDLKHLKDKLSVFLEQANRRTDKLKAENVALSAAVERAKELSLELKPFINMGTCTIKKIDHAQVERIVFALHQAPSTSLASHNAKIRRETLTVTKNTLSALHVEQRGSVNAHGVEMALNTIRRMAAAESERSGE